MMSAYEAQSSLPGIGIGILMPPGLVGGGDVSLICAVGA